MANSGKSVLINPLTVSKAIVHRNPSREIIHCLIPTIALNHLFSYFFVTTLTRLEKFAHRLVGFFTCTDMRQ